jgi:hypothetical protein
LPMTDVPEDEVVDRPSVALNERAERPGVTRLEREHQLLVGSLRSHCLLVSAVWS